MKAGERLVQIAGSGGKAADLLVVIGSGPNAGAALVNYSGFPGLTAAEHLLYERKRGTGPDEEWLRETAKRAKERYRWILDHRPQEHERPVEEVGVPDEISREEVSREGLEVFREAAASARQDVERTLSSIREKAAEKVRERISRKLEVSGTEDEALLAAVLAMLDDD